MNTLDEAYLTENYIPLVVPALVPPVGWNPQRPDPKTPYWKLLGWQQCMGNTVQNLLNWIGKVDPAMSSVAKMDTFSYYHGFELYLQKKNIKPGDVDIYVLEQHVAWANEMLHNSEFELEMRRNSGKEIAITFDGLVAYHNSTRRPAGLGTKLTKSGHIITSLDHVENTKQDWLVVSDPYGHFPYRQAFGHRVMYSRELLSDKITAAVLIQRKE
jgi:hypothetical protein